MCDGDPPPEDLAYSTSPDPSVDKNCISYWYPRLEKSSVPMPETALVDANDYIEGGPAFLNNIIDGEPCPGFDEFVKEIQHEASCLGYPAFLRTGHTAGKHDWKRCCFVDSPEVVDQRVAGLIEFSSMAGLFGLPLDAWAVREMLPTEPVFRCKQYGNMPVVPELRFFVRDSQVRYEIPYWPKEALEQGRPDMGLDWWPAYLEAMAVVATDELMRPIREMASEAGAFLQGDWSVDFLYTERGWFLTDVAEASMSWGFEKERFEEGLVTNPMSVLWNS